MSVMKMLGIDTRQFCGKSMRRGGLSAATNARVPELILSLQSGHGMPKASHAYMVPDDPPLLYATGRAVLEMGV